jgi:hypothetical protein
VRSVEFLAEGASLHQDNPGGQWLQHQQEDCAEAGKNQYGAPKRFGPVTGSFGDKVILPVHVVAKVKGIMGEQKNIRTDDLQSLMDYMKTNGHLPLNSNGKEYAPFIQVAYDGTPWVNEGNHRIMAATGLGWEWIPIELRYFSGGEEVEDGMLAPSKVIAWDAQGSAKR